MLCIEGLPKQAKTKSLPKPAKKVELLPLSWCPLSICKPNNQKKASKQALSWQAIRNLCGWWEMFSFSCICSAVDWNIPKGLHAYLLVSACDLWCFCVHTICFYMHLLGAEPNWFVKANFCIKQLNLSSY